MTGESPEHSLICSNLIAEVGLALKGTARAVYSPKHESL